MFLWKKPGGLRLNCEIMFVLYLYFVLFLCCNLLWINDKGKRGRYVTLYRWPAKQTIPLSVLTRNQTKGFWIWNLGVAGRGNGTREESWLEKGADRVGMEPQTGAVDTRHRSSETSCREDRVQRRRSSQDVGIPVALWNFR